MRSTFTIIGFCLKCNNKATQLKAILWYRFILQDLDELHLFVASDVAKLLQQKLDELMERNSYSEFEQ